MAIRSVFQGHWRALEQSWLIEFNKSGKLKKVAVVTAGQSLAKQLMGMIPCEVAGVRFLPGFPALSKTLANSVTGISIPESQRIALACQAGYMPENARAAAAFFERLIEMGVSADSFSVIAHSTKGLHKEVLRTSHKFTAYFSLRNNLHPASPDRIYAAGPKDTHRFQTYMFYGFYDLNPAQRKYVKTLSATADVLWFSPVHPSHHWRETSKRTISFLSGLGIAETHRVDGTVPLSNLAQFAENLLTEKAPGEARGIELLLCGSGVGFTKTVTDKVAALRKLYEDGDIAVIATGDDAKLLAEQMHLACIPSTVSLTMKASALPVGNLLLKLLRLEDNRFHHSDIEKLLLTGAITMDRTPDAASYAARAAKSGIRFDLKSLRETGFPFAETLADFFQELPSNATPEEFLRKTVQLLAILTDNSVPTVFTESILPVAAFTLKEILPFAVFKEMITVALDVTVKLQEPFSDGVAILSPEKARGIQKKALILTGLEEGAFPRPAVNDPRLPVEVKKQLQLPSPDTRETEEAFLLRQLFEAAEDRISIVCRNTDLSGRPVAVSPFLSPLLRDDSPTKAIQLSDSPVNILTIPVNPPFLSSSAVSQMERLRFDPENPSPDAVHCGMIGKGLCSSGRLSATKLESYARDPFSFLVEKIWEVRDSEEFPVRSEPDPRTRGSLVHSCVEKILKDGSSPADTVQNICTERGLTAHLGSEILAEIWMEHLVKGISCLSAELAEKQWNFVESEKSLQGTIAGLPAGGIIDLIFKNRKGEYILADLKTGKPKAITADNLIRKNLFQLPFYRNLAIQNNYSPLSEATYIHMESNGKITFKSLTDRDLENTNGEFEERILEIVESFAQGKFPENTRESASGYQS